MAIQYVVAMLKIIHAIEMAVVKWLDKKQKQKWSACLHIYFFFFSFFLYFLNFILFLNFT